MSKEHVPHNRYVSNGLHPHVYLAMVGLAAWYALSAWAGFGDGGYTDYLLVVMTGFIIISVALPAIAGRVWLRHHRRTSATAHSFEDWMTGEFDTGQGRMSAKTAVVELLLPLAAVAFGMTAFAIVARLVG
ncbi:MAG: hypothetical protein E5Y88_27490 [Mesorhizobium sp.]|nr:MULTISPECIES: hypothetical protein [Mesorhizobium]RWN41415.1 MAG: hypothetical protein EOR96_11355 [Mesorhizobium sp.]TIL22558.1 MAG: hypothetical protein E5Y88_27490 [Mesorhizobium sp.]TIU15861.1 MAG: hypothetical protein E5W40_01795 [Mesorhizobium sp.]WIW54692.1 hypothetical protein LRP31_05480 [Mesorhizobium mediterraneum]